MSTAFSGPSGAFEAHIKFSLSSLGLEDTPSWLLAGVIMNVIALMNSSAHLKLDPITTWMILSLRNEVSALCALYKVKEVEFRFNSPLDAPRRLILDLFAIDMSSGIVSENPLYWRGSKFTESETQLLLNFLDLVRVLMRTYGPEPVLEIIDHYNNKSAFQPNHIRHTGVGPRVANVYRGFEAATSTMATRTHAKSSVRFSPFGSRSRRAIAHPARPARLDLNDESSLRLLSDAPLRMRRRRVFGFGLL